VVGLAVLLLQVGVSQNLAGTAGQEMPPQELQELMGPRPVEGVVVLQTTVVAATADQEKWW